MFRNSVLIMLSSYLVLTFQAAFKWQIFLYGGLQLTTEIRSVDQMHAREER